MKESMNKIKLFLKDWGYVASGIVVIISMMFASRNAYLVGFLILIIAVLILVMRRVLQDE